VVVRRTSRYLLPLAALFIVLSTCLAVPRFPETVQNAVGLAGAELFSEGQQHAAADTPPVAVAAAVTSESPGGARDAYSIEASNNLRRRLARAAFLMINDYPFTGVGPGAFAKFLDHYAPDPAAGEVIDDRQDIPAHNVVLELWADSGTPAMVAYLLFLGASFLVVDRYRRTASGVDFFLAVGVAASLAALFVTSLFHNYQYDNLFWCLLGLAWSFVLWPRRSSTTPA
jgi:O-antigen ligase